MFKKRKYSTGFINPNDIALGEIYDSNDFEKRIKAKAKKDNFLIKEYGNHVLVLDDDDKKKITIVDIADKFHTFFKRTPTLIICTFDERKEEYVIFIIDVSSYNSIHGEMAFRFELKDLVKEFHVFEHYLNSFFKEGDYDIELICDCAFPEIILKAFNIKKTPLPLVKKFSKKLFPLEEKHITFQRVFLHASLILVPIVVFNLSIEKIYEKYINTQSLKLGELVDKKDALDVEIQKRKQTDLYNYRKKSINQKVVKN